ncbi:unnamed protein product [marine sediment metagenome]|uniref:Uncharacterized protein n=1 Tax=marine sediment metagenome TaxID=412755 RepID=X1R9W4_9ZZZZ
MSKLITEGRYAGLIAKGGNHSGVGGVNAIPGMVITTGLGSILHQVPLGRSFYVTKIMWFNPGVAATLDFGTLANDGVTPVPVFPTQNALAGLNGALLEEELAGAEFMLNSLAEDDRPA